jgi:hypothetical protein
MNGSYWRMGGTRSAIVSIFLGGDLPRPPGLFWYSEYYSYKRIGLEDYTSKCLPLKYNTYIYYKMAYMPYFYIKLKCLGYSSKIRTTPVLVYF